MDYNRPVEGVHSIPEIHTSHKHILGFVWPLNETLRHAWKYQSGQKEPNYPMPAIPIKIDLAQAGRWLAIARAFQDVADKYKQGFK